MTHDETADYPCISLCHVTWERAVDILAGLDFIRASEFRGNDVDDMQEIMYRLAQRGFHMLPCAGFDEWAIVHERNVPQWVADMNSESEFYERPRLTKSYVKGLIEQAKEVA